MEPVSTPLRIDVWSDVVCPFCFIGSVQLSEALATFEHEADVRVHAFELDPHAPTSSERPLADVLAAKYGISAERARAMNEQLAQQGVPLGLTFDFERVRLANSFDAHRLIALASSQGLGDEMRLRLYRAYFSDGELISDREVLSNLARDVGVTGAHELWSGDDFTAEVRDDERRASEMGISGVPAFVLDERHLVSGAQGTDVLALALTRAWEAREA